jgi:2,4-dienoyl-CoA reductase-like NADH-dependent reductase (Old Yellow Enzyme family)
MEALKTTNKTSKQQQNMHHFGTRLQVAKAVVEAVGAERVGYRLSPYGTFLDCVDSNPIPGTRYLAEQLSHLGIAYIHVVEGRINGNTDLEPRPDQTLTPFREVFKVHCLHLSPSQHAPWAEPLYLVVV